MSRPRHHRALVASSLVLGLAAAGLGALPQDAQTPSRQVFRAGANFVAVDAYPSRDGKIVDNLTRDDFEVLEDGKRQSIEQFEFVRGVPDGPDAEPRPTRLEAAERLAGDARRRVFVVYLTATTRRSRARPTRRRPPPRSSTSRSAVVGSVRRAAALTTSVISCWATGRTSSSTMPTATGIGRRCRIERVAAPARRRAGVQLHHDHAGEDA